MSFIRYLACVGDIVHITTLEDSLPGWQDYDPETCYLGFEIPLETEAGKAEIEDVFEFVIDDCKLTIAPPCNVPNYLRLIVST